jgi:hypothetical protein
MNARLLYNCASGFGEGSRLSLIRSLVRYGLDGDEIDPPDALFWPPLEPPHESSPSIADPFYIDFLGVVLEQSPGRE